MSGARLRRIALSIYTLMMFGCREGSGPDVYAARAIMFAFDDLDLNVVSGDLVEAAPHYEGPAQITALAAAKLAADICYLIAHSRREPPERPS